MPPQRKSGGNFFERRFLCFHKDSWISFQSDNWTSLLVFQRDMDPVFRNLDILDRFYTDTDTVRILDFLHWFYMDTDTVRIFGHLDVLDWFFYRTLD